jgi:hypothetical protein
LSRHRSIVHRSHCGIACSSGSPPISAALARVVLWLSFPLVSDALTGHSERVRDAVRVSPGLSRRIDLLAVAKPRANQRMTWFSGVLAVVGLIRFVSSAAAQTWGIAAISLGTAALAGLLCWVSLRAKRHVPATQRWLDEQRGSQ